MRMLPKVSLLAVIVFASCPWGGDGTDGEADTDTDADQTGFWLAGEGTATVAAGGGPPAAKGGGGGPARGWNGTQTDHWGFGTENGGETEVWCDWSSEVKGSDKVTTCPDCTFAYTVTSTVTAINDGDLCSGLSVSIGASNSMDVGYMASPNGAYTGYAVVNYGGTYWYLLGYATLTEAKGSPSTLDYAVPAWFYPYDH